MDQKKRCSWVVNTFEQYVRYHDEEWGVPVHDDRVHFEFLILESAQAGLSWSTILKKREAYRSAFADFDPNVVAGFGDEDVARLMENEGIVRYDKKIRSAINNAKCFLEVQKEFGSFDKYIWEFVDHQPIVNSPESLKDVPAKTVLSDQIAKDLKRRGFSFLGSTTVYAYMQACGLVSDHTTDCFRYHDLNPE
ncbi:DNA-3-methyladenine glycosylase I [Rhodohalobacter barkolensis]|uniref:DNA-3-methyladenine glycosylase I n=1 Tax=Rhodohalobacter barkolensis TaxID=2053187 RepID=A0A2N0VG58_9BACT|nr:DNA-3-methyladenine glycosylase I [Rhodohalobacter barkolensis]PKD43185.1 DNA-3-methyladenine glycosylase I [Rhodohalobacter barkolensis]